VYYDAAKKYNDDFTSLFYSSVLLGGIIGIIVFSIWDILVIFNESVRTFEISHDDFSLYSVLAIGAIVSTSNIIYFKSDNNYKKIIHHYRDIKGFKPRMLDYLKYYSIFFGLWALLLLIGTYIRYREWLV